MEQGEGLVEAAKLLAHPVRIAIVDLLRSALRSLRSGEVVQGIGLGRSTVLQHLGLLKEARWVRVVAEGSQLVYELDARQIAHDLTPLIGLYRRLGERSEHADPKGELLLFLCTGNSCRSQMAEAFFNRLGAESPYYARSGGTKPAECVHPLAVEVMAERGYDIGGALPKAAERYRGEMAPALVLFVCARAEDECSMHFPAARRAIAMPFDDPVACTGTRLQQLDAFRRVRDEIERIVQQFIAEL